MRRTIFEGGKPRFFVDVNRIRDFSDRASRAAVTTVQKFSDLSAFRRWLGGRRGTGADCWRGARLAAMPHPLASHLAPLIDRDVDELRTIVAHWVISESSEAERARYRRFGAELGALKKRIQARTTPPSEEEIEIALTALLALAGRGVQRRAD